MVINDVAIFHLPGLVVLSGSTAKPVESLPQVQEAQADGQNCVNLPDCNPPELKSGI